MIDAETREFITMEIARQIHPVGPQMDALISANEALAGALEALKGWCEQRGKHDDERYQRVLEMRDEFEEERMRKKVRAEMKAEDAKNGMRVREWLMIAATLLSVVIGEWAVRKFF